MGRVSEKTPVTKVLLAEPAEEVLSKLPKRVLLRMSKAIGRLAEDPVSGSHFLRSTDHGSNLHVIRVGDYRIIYSINQDINIVTVLTVNKSKDDTNG